MGEFKNSLIKLSAKSKLPLLFTGSRKNGLTTILYHSFFDENETIEEGRTRLKYQLDWVKNNYTPLKATEAVSKINNGSLCDFPLTVTADDALTDLIDVHDIFSDFEVPLTVFVCTGWVDNNAAKNVATLSRVIDFVRWYKGAQVLIKLGKYGELNLNQNSIDTVIDWVILQAYIHGDEFVQTVWQSFINILPEKKTRKVCTWDELQNLYKLGVEVGSHTVTHPPLAKCSDIRLNFEISKSKETLEAYFGDCLLFAYPFGTKEVVNDYTSETLKAVGYHSAFLTNANFAQNHSDRYRIPRMVMPDTKITTDEFIARIKGGAIPFDAVKSLLGRS